jgi:hypothetical protein
MLPPQLSRSLFLFYKQAGYVTIVDISPSFLANNIVYGTCGMQTCVASSFHQT